MPRAAIPKRKPILKQVAEDVVQGGQELIRQGKTAVGKVKEGYRKVKRFVSK